MAKIEQVPELGDRGYWYVLNAEQVESPPGSGRFGTQPAGLPDVHPGWTATYLDDGTVVIRTPEPITGIDTVDASSAKKLIDSGRVERPYGRIRGK